jgi:hypothetical protein
MRYTVEPATTDPASMSTRWQFVEGYEGNATHWSWRTVKGDGTIESQSQPFSTYGQAVSEAIKNGFQPRLQHWVVATRHTITHFRPGQAPMTVPVSDKDPRVAHKPDGEHKPDGAPQSGLGSSAEKPEDSHLHPPKTPGRRETH